MKEWDSGSYQRKFQGSLTIFRNVEKLERYMQLAVDHIDTLRVQGLELGSQLQKKYSLDEWEPIYYYKQAGFVSNHTLLLRKNIKSYQVGIGPSNYYLANAIGGAYRTYQYFSDLWHPMWLTLDLRDRWLPTKEDKLMALQERGAISKHLYLSPTSIYYHTTEIGSRKGKDFSTANPTIKQEIYDALKEVL